MLFFKQNYQKLFDLQAKSQWLTLFNEIILLKRLSFNFYVLYSRWLAKKSCRSILGTQLSQVKQLVDY